MTKIGIGFGIELLDLVEDRKGQGLVESCRPGEFQSEKFHSSDKSWPVTYLTISFLSKVMYIGESEARTQS